MFHLVCYLTFCKTVSKVKQYLRCLCLGPDKKKVVLEKMEATFNRLSANHHYVVKYNQIMEEIYIFSKKKIDEVFGESKNGRKYLFSYKDMSLVASLEKQFKYKISNHGLLDISEYVTGEQQPQMLIHHFDILKHVGCGPFLEVKEHCKANKKISSKSSKKRNLTSHVKT